MQFTGLNTAQLLQDPAQQMRYGYVRSNPLGYLDPFGLFETSNSNLDDLVPVRTAYVSGEVTGIGTDTTPYEATTKEEGILDHILGETVGRPSKVTILTAAGDAVINSSLIIVSE